MADGSRRSATVVVKELKESVLPPLDDELAKTATEFETLDELRADIEGRLRAQIDDELAGAFRAAAVDELVKASNVDARGRSSSCAPRAPERSCPQPRAARDRRRHVPAATDRSRSSAERRLTAEASLSVGRELILEAVADHSTCR